MCRYGEEDLVGGGESCLIVVLVIPVDSCSHKENCSVLLAQII